MRKWEFAIAAIMALAPGIRTAAAGDPGEGSKPGDVPKEVVAVQGTYIGSWSMYGINPKGEVVPRMAWKDTMKAEKAQVEGDRAFVVTTDEMVFEGGRIPPQTVAGKEGHFLNKDGSLGEAYTESFGQVHRMVPAGQGVWINTEAARGQELMQLGLPKDATGSHVLVKVVTDEAGVETHRITRVTTAQWKDRDGKDQAIQFVSMKGFHKRQP